jgi:hypothetical protein
MNLVDRGEWDNEARTPPYSPDLAVSDFYLFRHVKTKLSGRSFDEGISLLSVVEDILGSIEKST